MDPFSIVWAPLGRDLIENWRLPVEEGLFVPFLLDSENAGQIQSATGARLEPFDLLRGLLACYHQRMPLGGTERLQLVTPALVAYLGRGFGIATLEDTILGVAVRMREQYGSSLSRKALETGVALEPKSSKIRCDLVLDLWFLAQQAAEGDLAELFTAIVEHESAIDYERIDPRAVELPAYAKFVALHFLRRVEERDAYFREVVMQRVEHPAYKSRIKYLFDGNPFDMTALRIPS